MVRKSLAWVNTDRASRIVRLVRSALSPRLMVLSDPSTYLNRYLLNSDFGLPNMIGGRFFASADISLFKRYRFAKSKAHVYFKCFTNQDKDCCENRDRHKFLIYIALKNVTRTNSKASSPTANGIYGRAPKVFTATVLPCSNAYRWSDF